MIISTIRQLVNRVRFELAYLEDRVSLEKMEELKKVLLDLLENE